MLPRPTHNLLRRLRIALSCGTCVVSCAMICSCSNPEVPALTNRQTRINIDWSGFSKEVPTGMTVMCRNTKTDEIVQTISNNILAVTPTLPIGQYHITVFNLSEKEFDNINFQGLGTTDCAAVAAEKDAPQWHPHPADGDKYIAREPEWLAADMTLTEPVENIPTGSMTEPDTIGTLHPKNIIHSLHLTILTENISNIRAVRAAISGLAATRNLDGTPQPNNRLTVTHIIDSEQWSRQSLPSASDSGKLTANLRCFGLPANHNATPEENRLELQIMLADGKTVKQFLFPIGNLISGNTDSPTRRGDNLDLFLELRLDPPLPPASTGNSGIDAWIDDWDDYIDFNIPI